MTRSGGRPRHHLSTYIIILKDRQCICKACAEVLKENAKSITNRKERIKKHLLSCEHFWNKYGEEADEILNNCDSGDDEIPPNKQRRLDG